MPVIRIGENTGDDFSGFEDVFLRQTNPTINQDAQNIIDVNKYAANDWRIGLFNVSGASNIPAGSTINSVSIFFNLTVDGGTSFPVEMYRMVQSWVETTATWNTYDGSTSWNTGGAQGDGTDYDSTPLVATLTPTLTGGYKEWTGANLVQFFQDIVDGIYPNNGLNMIHGGAGSDSLYLGFISSEGADGSRPYALIDYTPPSSALGQSSETNIANAIAVLAAITIGVSSISETELAQPISVIGSGTVQVSQVVETEISSLISLTSSNFVQVFQVSTAATASPILSLGQNILEVLQISEINYSILITVGYASEITHYVSNSGTATTWTEAENINTPADPFFAHLNAVAGNVVAFRGGDYLIDCEGGVWDYPVLRPANNGSAGNPIKFVRYPGEIPFMKKLNADTHAEFAATHFGARSSSYIIWDGFWTNLEDTTLGDGQYGTNFGFYMWGCDNCLATNFVAIGANQGSPTSGGNSAMMGMEVCINCEITNSLLYGNKGTSPVNIMAIWLFANTDCRVANCEIHTCDNGIGQKTGSSNGNIIELNYFYNIHGTDCGWAYHNSQEAAGNTTNYIRNNLFRDVDVCVLLDSNGFPTNNWEVVHNTGVNSVRGLETADQVYGLVKHSNLWYGIAPIDVRAYALPTYPYSMADYDGYYPDIGFDDNAGTGLHTSLTSLFSTLGYEQHGTVADPLFVNAAGTTPEDFILNVGSTYIGAGFGGSNIGVENLSLVGIQAGTGPVILTGSYEIDTAQPILAIFGSFINVQFTTESNISSLIDAIPSGSILIAHATENNLSETISQFNELLILIGQAIENNFSVSAFPINGMSIQILSVNENNFSEIISIISSDSVVEVFSVNENDYSLSILQPQSGPIIGNKYIVYVNDRKISILLPDSFVKL